MVALIQKEIETEAVGVTNPSIVTIGTVKTVKTFFFAFPALNSTAMNKKLKYSNFSKFDRKIPC